MVTKFIDSNNGTNEIGPSKPAKGNEKLISKPMNINVAKLIETE